MLSCRYSGPGSVPYNRRLASADRILDIISHGGHESLPPLPLVPYAMSMSTTMIYRALRDGQRDMDAAHKDLCLCCDALDALSQRWTSAKGVARLAKHLLGVLAKSGGLNGNDHARRSSKPDAGTLTAAADRSSIMINQRNNEAATMAGVVPPKPVSVQAERALQEEQALASNQNFQSQLREAWPGIHASYSQLDTAFHDLFDYGMPNVFRDPATWEFLHMANDEECAVGSEFQFSPYLASPELEFGYPHLHVTGAQDISEVGGLSRT